MERIFEFTVRPDELPCMLPLLALVIVRLA